jgi:hypothetical protein
MPIHQSAETADFPRMPPVVNRLMSNASFLGDRRGYSRTLNISLTAARVLASRYGWLIDTWAGVLV